MLMVCSSPQYPLGIFDHCKEICALGLKRNIPVHMDSCLGSFLTPLVHEAGFLDLPLLNSCGTNSLFVLHSLSSHSVLFCIVL